MVHKAPLILSFVIFASASAAGAEEILFRNGDRISGEVVNETEDELTVKTAAMGTVIVKKEHLKAPPAGEPAAAVREKIPEWSRKFSLGYSQAGGNTEKSQGTVAVLVNRKTGSDEWTAKGNAYYASTDKQMDAKKFYGMLRYAFSYGRDLRWYNFYKLEGSQDRFSNIDYRVTPSTGVGYWFSDEEDFRAMAEAAAGFEYTNYRDGTKSEGEAVLVPRGFLEKKILGELRLFQDVTLYPSLEDTGEFRLHSETALVHPITEQLSWKVSFIDDFDSDPAGDTKKNDYRLISSVDYAF